MFEDLIEKLNSIWTISDSARQIRRQETTATPTSSVTINTEAEPLTNVEMTPTGAESVTISELITNPADPHANEEIIFTPTGTNAVNDIVSIMVNPKAAEEIRSASAEPMEIDETTSGTVLLTPVPTTVEITPTKPESTATIEITDDDNDNTSAAECISVRAAPTNSSHYHPKSTSSMNKLFRVHGLKNGLPTNGALIPEPLITDLILEARDILDNPSALTDRLDESEKREVLNVFAIVSKTRKIPCIDTAKVQLSLNLQETEERDDIDAETFANIIGEPINHTQVLAPFSSLRIEKSEACRLLSMECAAPEILFESNRCPKNKHGFPCSDFSRRLKLTSRAIIEEGIRSRLMTATCAAVSAYNRSLIETGVTLNTAPVIGPLTAFRQSVLDTGKTLTKLVDQYTDYRGARRRSVKARLEMETKMRCLVSVHFADMALLLASPPTDTDICGWEILRNDLKCAINGLYFVINLPDTFP